MVLSVLALEVHNVVQLIEEEAYASCRATVTEVSILCSK